MTLSLTQMVEEELKRYCIPYTIIANNLRNCEQDEYLNVIEVHMINPNIASCEVYILGKIVNICVQLFNDDYDYMQYDYYKEFSDEVHSWRKIIDTNKCELYCLTDELKMWNTVNIKQSKK